MIGLTCRNNLCHLSICMALFILLILLDLSWGADADPRGPAKDSRCPVCGMTYSDYELDRTLLLDRGAFCVHHLGSRVECVGDGAGSGHEKSRIFSDTRKG